MLANLNAEVRECLWRAEDCSERAKIELNPAMSATTWKWKDAG